MAMSLRENITAVIETCFSESKEEIQEVAINKIFELIENDKVNRKTESQTDDPQDWKDRMWAEAVIESQTERSE